MKIPPRAPRPLIASASAIAYAGVKTPAAPAELRLEMIGDRPGQDPAPIGDPPRNAPVQAKKLS